MWREKPALAALTTAILNGLVVLIIGPAAYWNASTNLRRSAITMATLVVMPFAALAAWRTWVYARRWIERRESGWRGVLEAGVCGLLTALCYFAPSIAGQGARALPAVVIYSLAATAVGLILGCVLRASALIVLLLFRSADALTATTRDGAS